ncbi:tRNA uridine-5-carboxymethylaminomethyl(34) synthesis GTPase MnmE [Sphingomonas baiyangensis]|uniref:tRNA modification GTPase MnmE n=1 Tax=Sphingomonas baiyangensis TaxID=2572576 RepID=A0A4U1L6K8_9SPHN|nr:tRNA uridine-5-carboxymethylaminomethyl(34) synthesis GTPase MnmE [Sphingomonas baiyangensis]TKD51930.1 tRNA uridine-5-carboxymethylaminomethyl(34) synthesis GTPase MnmE [Sphingomonas baiyangensis]
MHDTIVALSSGALPAAIAVLRLSGPQALAAAGALAGDLPPDREARLRGLRDGAGALLDRAMVIVLRAPATVTGEDMVELHLHGGRAVVRAVEAALVAIPGVRLAEAGEFTRRALMHGRTTLTEVEGLALLLAAESDAQRRSAHAMADGTLRRNIAMLQREVLRLSARVEALLDFSDEGDVTDDARVIAAIGAEAADLAVQIRRRADTPTVDRLHAGFRVVLAGPPNAGKSSLLNALVDHEAAIVSDIPGTTRDRIAVPISRGDYSYVLTDTAGIRSNTDDPIERMGIERSVRAIDEADLVLWLGDDAPVFPSVKILLVHARADLPSRGARPPDRVGVSVHDPASLDDLWCAINDAVTDFIPQQLDTAMNQRQRALLLDAARALEAGGGQTDAILLGEQLRGALGAFDRITGAAGIEAMFDDLFSSFCIGK